MMFAILKNNFEVPVALFEIERETAKRYYGRLHDTVHQDNWFFLRGLTRGRGEVVSHCTKDIVMCLLPTDASWHLMKPVLARIQEDYRSRNRLIQDEECRRRTRTREQEQDNRKRAMYEAQEEIDKYVCTNDML